MRGFGRFLTIAVLLVAATPLTAQMRAAATLGATIPAVAVLQVQRLEGRPVPAGPLTEMRGALNLMVKANCRWRIVAVGTASQPVWVRAHPGAGYSAAATAFVPLRSELVVATGEAGISPGVVLDLRLAAGASADDVRFQVEPLRVEQIAIADQPAGMQAGGL